MKIILNNLGLKILSIFLAVLLWFYVQGREISEMVVKYGIIYSNLSDNLYIENASASEINVWLKGPKNLLKRYSKNDVKLEINLKDFPEGKHIIDIKEEMLRLAGGLEVTRIQPNRFNITLAKYIEKKVRVMPNYSGNKKVILEPSEIKIKGERKTVWSTNVIFTEEFEAKGRKTFYVKLVQPSESVKLEVDKVKVMVY